VAVEGGGLDECDDVLWEEKGEASFEECDVLPWLHYPEPGA
jgi:hypothetical protein